MTFHQFIFSPKRQHRIARHLAFWANYFIYTVLYEAPLHIEDFKDPWYLTNSLWEALDYFSVHFFFVYFLMYYILPNYLKRKKIKSLVLAAGVAVVIIVPLFFISEIYIHNRRPDWGTDEIITQAIIQWRRVVIIAGYALIIKIMKSDFLRQKESERLAIENINNKLRLLKKQMHPHILFKCLDNIYLDIEAGTKHAPEMVLKLSELLSYLLYEAEAKQVLLSNEVRMIENYVALKKLEDKNKLDISVEINGEINEYYIMPGLFLSLLEIGMLSFHEYKMLLLVTIELKIVSAQLRFSLKNNFQNNGVFMLPFEQELWHNARKRLEIFYPDKYKLEAYSNEGSITIMLQLKLDSNVVDSKNIQLDQSLAYEYR